MATSLARRASQSQTIGLFRISLNFLKSFSSTTISASPSPTPASASSKPKRRKKNLFEVVQFLPHWGIGYHLAKTHWTNVSYEITKINLCKDGKHGKAWGIVHKDGLPSADAPKKIIGVHKRCWKYIPSLSKSAEATPKLTASTEIAPTAEFQAS